MSSPIESSNLTTAQPLTIPTIMKGVGQGALFITICVTLFSLVFFLGAYPTKLIDNLSQHVFMYIYHNVENESLKYFLIDGVFAGIAGFMVYMPNIMAMFFLAHAMTQTGLSSKAASFIHPFFKMFGLNGYSFPPLIFGFGCSVSAIHSAQYIDKKKGRLLTMLIAPFMSCGAKVGVYLLLIGVMFPMASFFDQGLIFTALYLIGIAAALASVVVFRKILGIKKEDVIIDDTIPSRKVKNADWLKVTRLSLRDGWIFLKKAGPVIILVSMVIWALSTYHVKTKQTEILGMNLWTIEFAEITPEQYAEVQAAYAERGEPIPPRKTANFHLSTAAQIGQSAPMEFIFSPLGQDWRNSVAIVTSVVGRGLIISSMITLYGIERVPGFDSTLVTAISSDPNFTMLAGMTMLLFVLLCGSCLASVKMFYEETKSRVLTGLFFAYPYIVAWCAAVVFYQIGSMFFGS